MLQEKLERLQKNLDIENSPPPSPDSELTKTLEEHYQERVKKLEQEIDFLKKRYVDFLVVISEQTLASISNI